MHGFSVIPSGLHPAATSPLGQRRSSDETESHGHLCIPNAQIWDPTIYSADQLSTYADHRVHWERNGAWLESQQLDTSTSPIASARKQKSGNERYSLVTENTGISLHWSKS